MRCIGSPTMFERMRATVWAGSAAADEDEIYSASRLSCSRQATPLHSRQPLPHCVQLPDFSPSPTQVPHHTQFLLEWRGHCIIFLHLDLFNSKLVSVLYCICRFFLILETSLFASLRVSSSPGGTLDDSTFTCSGIFSQRIGRNSGQLIWLDEDFRTRGTPGLRNCWLPSWLGFFESVEGNAGCLIPETDMVGSSWYTRRYLTRAPLTAVFHFLQFDFPFPILLVWKKIHRLNAGSNSLPKLGSLLKCLFDCQTGATLTLQASSLLVLPRTGVSMLEP